MFTSASYLNKRISALIFKTVLEMNEKRVNILFMISKNSIKRHHRSAYLNCAVFLHQTPKVEIIWPANELEYSLHG